MRTSHRTCHRCGAIARAVCLGCAEVRKLSVSCSAVPHRVLRVGTCSGGSRGRTTPGPLRTCSLRVCIHGSITSLARESGLRRTRWACTQGVRPDVQCGAVQSLLRAFPLHACVHVPSSTRSTLLPSSPSQGVALATRSVPTLNHLHHFRCFDRLPSPPPSSLPPPHTHHPTAPGDMAISLFTHTHTHTHTPRCRPRIAWRQGCLAAVLFK
jgi:hypothetical protein